jgi:hypothetical protein
MSEYLYLFFTLFSIGLDVDEEKKTNDQTFWSFFFFSKSYFIEVGRLIIILILFMLPNIFYVKVIEQREPQSSSTSGNYFTVSAVALGKRKIIMRLRRLHTEI